MFGIVIQEPEEDEDTVAADAQAAPVFYLLPENERAWRLWLRVQTQWRIGPAGYPTGLDYSGVVARMGRVARRRQAQLLDEVQVMELAALSEFAVQREQQRMKRQG